MLRAGRFQGLYEALKDPPNPPGDTSPIIKGSDYASSGFWPISLQRAPVGRGQHWAAAPEDWGNLRGRWEKERERKRAVSTVSISVCADTHTLETNEAAASTNLLVELSFNPMKRPNTHWIDPIHMQPKSRALLPYSITFSYLTESCFELVQPTPPCCCLYSI